MMNDEELCSSVLEELITFWHFHRRFDANIVDLARHVSVSRDTVYRWLNRKALPRPHKAMLIAEWLEFRNKA
ncbi:MAG: helix-turn-helix transcriptional regulator [Candidatus Tritonobacter lacicola]|nr:helix-turn-helix transcriptional regulator [Candidatus Tritonobacter lacicola]